MSNAIDSKAHALLANEAAALLATADQNNRIFDDVIWLLEADAANCISKDWGAKLENTRGVEPLFVQGQVRMNVSGLLGVATAPVGRNDISRIASAYYGDAGTAFRELSALKESSPDAQINLREGTLQEILGPFWDQRLQGAGLEYQHDADAGIVAMKCEQVLEFAGHTMQAHVKRQSWRGARG